jgi:predicted murein hydrolase (TIGR00659 family)
MTDAERLYEVWVYLQAEPLFWLTLTIGCYLFADFLYKSSGLFPLLNPVALSIAFVSACLIIFNVEYERYFNGAKFIHFLLGPATVALAVPIYLNWRIVSAERLAILATVVMGSLFAIGMTFGISLFLDVDLVTVKSMLPRNVTAPIAMGISELIGGIPSLTAIITIVTGVVGAALGTFVLDLVRIKNMPARGFAFGLTSHGIGTARAMSRDQTAGVFAAVAMGLSGVTTALLLPLIFRLISDLL